LFIFGEKVFAMNSISFSRDVSIVFEFTSVGGVRLAMILPDQISKPKLINLRSKRKKESMYLVNGKRESLQIGDVENKDEDP
jgi:hypothetical protein